MDEIRFVLKGLAVACLVTILLQFKVGGESLEMRSDRWLHHSSVGIFLNQTAEGASDLLRKAGAFIRGFVNQNFGSQTKKTEFAAASSASENRSNQE